MIKPKKTLDSSNNKLRFSIKAYSSLSLEELYEIMALRQEVFIVEQNCPYQDADHKDQQADHLMCHLENKLVAYTRILPKGVSYEKYTSIGRVVNNSSVRGTGVGKTLMQESIAFCKKKYPQTAIKISAQCYLQKFYESLGFKSNGDYYDEDDIPHMAMILSPEES